MFLIQLGPGGADDHDRHVSRPQQEIFQELHECVVDPVEVFDDHHQWLNRGEIFEEPAPCCERLALVSPFALQTNSNQWAQLGLHPFTRRDVAADRLESNRQLLACSIRVVRLPDPGLALDDLSESPEGDPLSVWKASALSPPDDLGLVVGPLPEFVDQAGLAHSWRCRHGHEPQRLVVQHPAESLGEQTHLRVAAEERGVCPESCVDPVPPPGLYCAPHLQWL